MQSEWRLPLNKPPAHRAVRTILEKCDKWVYNVASHGLADLFNLSPKELEEEMNNGRFAKRVINRDDLAKLMREGEELVKSKKNFKRVFVVLDKNEKERKIELSFTYVDDLTNNIVYVLNSKIID